MAGMPRKEVQALLKHLEGQGARLEEKKSGTMIFFPDGSTAMAHWTTSDKNAFRPLRAAVKRAGLTWPNDHTHAKEKSSRTTLKLLRKVFHENKYRELSAAEIIQSTGLTYPTISRAERSGELVKIKRGVYKLPEVLSPVLDTELTSLLEKQGMEQAADFALDEMEDTPYEPKYPNIEHAKKLLTTPGNPKVSFSVEGNLTEPGKYTGTVEQIDFIDERDSWVVDLNMLPTDITLFDLERVYQAAGLNMEVRIWKS